MKIPRFLLCKFVLANVLTSAIFLTHCSKTKQNTAVLTVAPTDSCSVHGLPNTLEFNKQAHQQALYQLTDCQRQKLLMDAEGMAISWPNRAKPGGKEFAPGPVIQTLRGIEVPAQEVTLKGVEWNVDHYDPVNGLPIFKTITQAAGIEVKANSIQIPIHPTTSSLHPLIERLKGKGYKVKDLKPVVATMSRSLWNPQNTYLWTMKMGSDFVHGRKADNKLGDVGEDIASLENNALTTSIPDFISTLDVGYLVDRAAVTISLPDLDNKDLTYTIALRDYTPLIQDRYRIYMPQYLLFQKGAFKSNGPGTPRTFVLPYSWGKEITMAEDDITSILNQLNQDMARVVAIHHANGYMPLDFHAQNVLIGIPLSREVKPRLVIRDVGDIYEFTFPNSVRERPNGWPGVKTIKVDSMVCYDPSRIQWEAYIDQMKKMNFSLPGGSWSNLRGYSIDSISYESFQKNQDAFWKQVKTIRQQGLSRRCSNKVLASKARVCGIGVGRRPVGTLTPVAK